jgi:hypothetical protein
MTVPTPAARHIMRMITGGTTEPEDACDKLNGVPSAAARSATRGVAASMDGGVGRDSIKGSVGDSNRRKDLRSPGKKRRSG